ncbi:MAG TPA: CDC27 family protein [Pirellulaceae bacterium]|nr:CDC27 family protein [Pirellulaceae bacterium]HMP67925.1 CDC27 family protein [Pirellulaceae bacterium]
MINDFGKSRVASWVALIMLGLTVGCNTDVTQVEDLHSVALFSTDAQLPKTMSYIRSIQRYDHDEFQKNVVAGLTRWHKIFAERGENVDWAPPTLLDSLPVGVQRWKAVSSLDMQQFTPTDANYLQEVYWLERVGRRVLASERLSDFNMYIELAKPKMSESQFAQFAESSDQLAFVMHVLHPNLEPPGIETDYDDGLPSEGAEGLEHEFGVSGEYQETDSQRLAATMRLFDWVVRNAQLRNTAGWPAPQDIRSLTTFDVAFGELPNWPPAAGVAGPGYTRMPWHVLTYGKSDYLERANLFLGMLEQAGLDGVMLAVPVVKDSEGETSVTTESDRPYEEWLVGVFVGDDIYLFDTELGIPLPGREPGQIATLQQVLEDPSLITGLSLTVDESFDPVDYRISPDRLKDLIVLVRAAPESLSLRMRQLELSLTGDDRLNLTFDFLPLMEKIKSNQSLQEQSIRLWHVPFSTHQYRETINLALSRANIDRSVAEKLSWHFVEEGYIDVFTSFRSVINIYLHGRFNMPRFDTRLSAVEGFSRFTYDDEEIATFEQDTLLQSQLGVYKRKEQSFNEWQTQLMIMKDQMRRIRADAAFYTALSHYENGKPDTALNWLSRIDRIDTEGRWASASNYQMARAYEAIGEYAEANRIYRRKGSPQRYGNVIRARTLDAILNKDNDT